MRKKTVLYLALASLALLFGCGRGHMEPARRIDVEGQFALNIPANFVPCTDLHEFAPLQMADDRGGYFLMGIMEPKEKMVKLKDKYEVGDYAAFVEAIIGDAYDTAAVTRRDTMEIHGLHCHSADMFAAITDEEAPIEVYYHLSVYESPSHFYQLIGWSHHDRQESFAEAAREIEHSFEELGTGLTAEAPQSK